MRYNYYKINYIILLLLNLSQTLASNIEELDIDIDEANIIIYNEPTQQRYEPFIYTLLEERNPNTNYITGIDNDGVFYSITRIDDKGVSHLIRYKDDGTPYIIEDFFAENNKNRIVK